jgi:PKD repeat protein
MKKSLCKKMCLTLFTLLAVFAMNAQYYAGEQARLLALEKEEQKIVEYVQQHLEDELPEEIQGYVDQILRVEQGHQHGDELSPADLESIKVQLKRNYFRNVYLRENPKAAALFQAAAIGNCTNGDFEAGDFSGYSAASGLRNEPLADCDVASIFFTAETPQTPETVSAAGGINCEITNAVPDPLIPSLSQVHTGNHAARINQTSVLYGINQITKELVLTQTNENIAFWYALVMQNPNGHNNQQPYFKARALNQAGVVLDEICEFADSANIFFDDTIISGQVVVYSDYFCDRLEVSGNIGDTITLEISTADCGRSGHWGYSYVDDICDVCTIDSCNFQGSIDLNPTDTCQDTMQVCGTYDLAAFQCSTATVDNISLNIIQGGSIVNVITGPSIDFINQTFCFSIVPGDFGGFTGGFDFEAVITFDINGSLTTESDLNTNPGPDNDYLTDPDCCPEFRILDCCTYWDLEAKGVSIDPRIAAEVQKYRSNLQKKYGSARSTSDCDPCTFPTDSFPIFIVDENNMLIDDSYYSISWTHQPGWTAAYSWIFPNQSTTATVVDPITGCEWMGDFHFDCCEFEAEIVPLCTTCDPCSNPNQPFFLVVEDQNGNSISTTGYTFNWSTGSTASGINGVVNTVYWVEVTELATGCVDTDTFEIACCECTIGANFNFNINKCDVDFNSSVLQTVCTSGITYAWDFGDGNTSSAANPSHTYAGNGTYVVCLIVEGNDGNQKCSDTICQQVEIRDCNSCECDLEGDFRFEVDKCDVRFEADAQANQCTQIDKFIWDFGDGSTGTGQFTGHTYAMNGTYTVCLIVEGNDGLIKCSDTICYQVEIRDCESCVCKLDPDFRFEVDRCKVTFEGDAGASPCTEVEKYIWDFGDGNTNSGQFISHTYAANGTYEVCLTVVGNDGKNHCEEKICYIIEITDCEDCECKIEADFLGLFGIQDPCTVFFNDISTISSCTQVTGYKWDFGDGTNSSLQNPAHTFPGDGTYTVCLTVEGNDGKVICKDQMCRTITISGCRGGSSSSFKSGDEVTTDDVLNDFAATVYPNPFSERFTISFSNPVAQQMEITLLDASGKQVALLSSAQYEAGAQSVSFDAMSYNLTDGVYFIALKSDKNVSYKKIVFSK